MDSGNHPSIITQVTRDSERAKYEAELQSGAQIDINIAGTQVYDNATSETLFSPTAKATEGGAVASNKKDEHEQQQTGGKSQPGKAKSLFCCFKICKRPGKQNDRANKSSAAKHKAPNGSSQTDFGTQHDNARSVSRSNGEHHGDGTRPPNGAASYGNAHTSGGLLPPLVPGQPARRCVVVDLDETLVHSSFKPVDKPDLTVDVEIDDQVHQVYVLKRPFADEFLVRLGQLFECVLFTASLSKYADPVTNWLDNHEQKVFSARLFRDACVLHKGNYVKDLSRLGRPLESVVIVDNSPASYCFHPQNAVPVKSWFDDPSDRELLELIPLFERLATCDDIYAVLAQHHAERQSQHAQEMALMRLYPLAFATVHTPAATGVVQLPPYQLVAGGGPQPAPPTYVALPPAQPIVPVPVQPPASTSDLAHCRDSSPGQPEMPPSSGAMSTADVNAHNSTEPPMAPAASGQTPSAELAATLPIADPEVAAAAITAGADVSVTAPQTDEDRSLFSPTPVPPLFITPPTPRLGTVASHSHSASASHTTWSVATSDNDADASKRDAPRQRRNSAGSHKSHRRDSQKRRSARPVSTHPEFGASAVTNSNAKPADATP